MDNRQEEPRMVTAFEYENALMHYGKVNKRSLIALVSVCVTFILVTTIFVVAYTIRERNWLKTIQELRTPYVVEVGADGGIHEQPNP